MKKRLIFICILSLIAIFFVSCSNESKSQSSTSSSSEAQVATYEIYVAPTQNATVNVASQAQVGETVTINVTPDQGYYLEKITVNGQQISSSSFVMPSFDVLINVQVKNGQEEYAVKTSECQFGQLYAVTEKAKLGEPCVVRAFPYEGYRIDALYANGIKIPTEEKNFGYEATAMMVEQGLTFTATFVPCEKITSDYKFTLTASSPTNPAISHWKMTYTETGIKFSILVEDDTYVGTGTFADGVDTQSYSVYNSDNVEFQICYATREQRADIANVLRCLANVNGRYKLEKANSVDSTFDKSSLGIGVEYGKNFSVDSVPCTESKNGFNGYALAIYLGYDLFGVNYEQAKGNITFTPAIRDSVSYDHATKTLTSYWYSLSYNWTGTTFTKFLSDDYRTVWTDPSTFLGIDQDGNVFSRFVEVRKNADYLFLGDSYMSTTYWGMYKEDVADLDAYSMGFGGSKASQWLNTSSIDLVAEISPKNLVAHIGLNDINLEASTSGIVNIVITRVTDLLNAWHTKMPSTKIYWLAFDPNPNHASEYLSNYVSVNDAIKALNYEWLTVIDLGQNFLNGDGSVNASLFADGIHFNSYGYATYINEIRKALNLGGLSEGSTFGSSQKAYATSGWTENVVDGKTILECYATSSKFSERYIYDKDFFGDNFTVSAKFNASQAVNNDANPKFGFVIDDGVNKFLYYIGSNNKLFTKKVGYVTNTPSSNKGVFNWSSGVEKDLNVYFTENDFASLSLTKSGNIVTLKVSGQTIFTQTLSVCTGDVSVGIFSFNTIITVTDYNLEVVA